MAESNTEIGAFSLQSAKLFSEKYANITNEKQYSQSFWTDLFTKVIGVPDLLAAGIEFEYPVISSEGKTNWIDVFWSGVLLIEQKSTGKNLDLAETQARSYLVGLPPEHRHRYSLTINKYLFLSFIDIYNFRKSKLFFS